MKKQLTMSSLGSNGRLGNQLFQYASLMGLSMKFNADLCLGDWSYRDHFNHSFPSALPDCPQVIKVKEPTFKYVPNWPYIEENQAVDIWGYLQSEKYWKHCEGHVRKALTFKPEFVEQCRARFDEEDLKDVIAISIRRGDFVSNPNYEQLPIVSYYILALFEHFPDWRKRNIIIFSDDIPYCRVHFNTLENVMYSENNSDIEDICLMSQCKDFIIANSTFSWWGAYLSNTKGKIIRPKKIFAGDLAKSNDESDFYPPEWIVFDHHNPDGTLKKINLSDVTFTIPVAYDHENRRENLDLCIRTLKRNFDCDIVVCEQVGVYASRRFEYVISIGARGYIPFPSEKFHRTKMLNIMARYTKNPIVFNWDADVFIAPLQILEAVEMLRKDYDLVLPYNWAFARLPRDVWFVKIRDYEDIGMVGDKRFNGMNTSDVVSFGGAVGFKRESFIRGGMENERFISYGPEDVERWIRFTKLGYRCGRAKGSNLYHMNHYIGPNSSPRHADFNRNSEEYAKVARMSTEELEAYIKTWNWL